MKTTWVKSATTCSHVTCALFRILRTLFKSSLATCSIERFSRTKSTLSWFSVLRLRKKTPPSETDRIRNIKIQVNVGGVHVNFNFIDLLIIHIAYTLLFIQISSTATAQQYSIQSLRYLNKACTKNIYWGYCASGSLSTFSMSPWHGNSIKFIPIELFLVGPGRV